MSDVQNVRVIRYIRRRAPNDNLGGATLLFDLDYTRRTVEVSLSICREDENFDKHAGVDAAIAGGVVRVINLDGFRNLADTWGGFTQAYANMLITGVCFSDVNKRELDFYNLVLSNANYGA